MTKKLTETYRLPSGKITTSTRRYIREWRAFNRKIGDALGCVVFAFDPDLAMADKFSEGGIGQFVLPLWVAKRILAALDAKND